MRDDRRTARVRRFYRLLAPGYDRLRAQWGRWTSEAERALDRLFAERIGSGARVLELAPGTGINIARLQRHAPDFASYLGIDASPAMLARARRVAGGDARIELREGDVTDLSGVPGPYDFVVSTWLLAHLHRPERVVGEALARLAPGGTAVFVFTTRPRNAVLASLVALVFRAGTARFVDRDAVAGLPGLERLESFTGGMATLAVFRKAAAG